MNQNTTIETIREAIRSLDITLTCKDNKCGDCTRYVQDVRSALDDLVNRLEPAPPAVIEPEPELDEFEQWLSQVWCKEYRLGVNAAIAKYREIVTRKGDK